MSLILYINENKHYYMQKNQLFLKRETEKLSYHSYSTRQLAFNLDNTNNVTFVSQFALRSRHVETFESIYVKESDSGTQTDTLPQFIISDLVSKVHILCTIHSRERELITRVE